MTGKRRVPISILAALLAGNIIAQGSESTHNPAVPGNAAAYRALTQTVIHPVELVELAPGHFFADFGRAAFAKLELRVAQADEGRKVTVHLGEKIRATQRGSQTGRFGPLPSGGRDAQEGAGRLPCAAFGGRCPAHA